MVRGQVVSIASQEDLPNLPMGLRDGNDVVVLTRSDRHKRCVGIAGSTVRAGERVSVECHGSFTLPSGGVDTSLIRTNQKGAEMFVSAIPGVLTTSVSEAFANARNVILVGVLNSVDSGWPQEDSSIHINIQLDGDGRGPIDNTQLELTLGETVIIGETPRVMAYGSTETDSVFKLELGLTIPNDGSWPASVGNPDGSHPWIVIADFSRVRVLTFSSGAIDFKDEADRQHYESLIRLGKEIEFVPLYESGVPSHWGDMTSPDFLFYHTNRSSFFSDLIEGLGYLTYEIVVNTSLGFSAEIMGNNTPTYFGYSSLLDGWFSGGVSDNGGLRNVGTAITADIRSVGTSSVIGLIMGSGEIPKGDPALFIRQGVYRSKTPYFTAGSRYFLGRNGSLVREGLMDSSNVGVYIGQAISPIEMHIDIDLIRNFADEAPIGSIRPLMRGSGVSLGYVLCDGSTPHRAEDLPLLFNYIRVAFPDAVDGGMFTIPLMESPQEQFEGMYEMKALPFLSTQVNTDIPLITKETSLVGGVASDVFDLPEFVAFGPQGSFRSLTNQDLKVVLSVEVDRTWSHESDGKEPVYFGQLFGSYDIAMSLDRNQYTANTWIGVELALEASVDVFEAVAPTQTSINEAFVGLTQSLNALLPNEQYPNAPTFDLDYSISLGGIPVNPNNKYWQEIPIGVSQVDGVDYGITYSVISHPTQSYPILKLTTASGGLRLLTGDGTILYPRDARLRLDITRLERITRQWDIDVDFQRSTLSDLEFGRRQLMPVNSLAVAKHFRDNFGDDLKAKTLVVTQKTDLYGGVHINTGPTTISQDVLSFYEDGFHDEDGNDAGGTPTATINPKTGEFKTTQTQSLAEMPSDGTLITTALFSEHRAEQVNRSSEFHGMVMFSNTPEDEARVYDVPFVDQGGLVVGHNLQFTDLDKTSTTSLEVNNERVSLQNNSSQTPRLAAVLELPNEIGALEPLDPVVVEDLNEGFNTIGVGIGSYLVDNQQPRLLFNNPPIDAINADGVDVTSLLTLLIQQIKSAKVADLGVVSGLSGTLVKPTKVFVPLYGARIYPIDFEFGLKEFARVVSPTWLKKSDGSRGTPEDFAYIQLPTVLELGTAIEDRVVHPLIPIIRVEEFFVSYVSGEPIKKKFAPPVEGTTYPSFFGNVELFLRRNGSVNNPSDYIGHSEYLQETTGWPMAKTHTGVWLRSDFKEVIHFKNSSGTQPNLDQPLIWVDVTQGINRTDRYWAFNFTLQGEYDLFSRQEPFLWSAPTDEDHRFNVDPLETTPETEEITLNARSFKRWIELGDTSIDFKLLHSFFYRDRGFWGFYEGLPQLLYSVLRIKFIGIERTTPRYLLEADVLDRIEEYNDEVHLIGSGYVLDDISSLRGSGLKVVGVSVLADHQVDFVLDNVLIPEEDYNIQIRSIEDLTPELNKFRTKTAGQLITTAETSSTSLVEFKGLNLPRSLNTGFSVGVRMTNEQITTLVEELNDQRFIHIQDRTGLYASIGQAITHTFGVLAEKEFFVSGTKPTSPSVLDRTTGQYSGDVNPSANNLLLKDLEGVIKERTTYQFLDETSQSLVWNETPAPDVSYEDLESFKEQSVAITGLSSCTYVHLKNETKEYQAKQLTEALVIPPSRVLTTRIETTGAVKAQFNSPEYSTPSGSVVAERTTRFDQLVYNPERDVVTNPVYNSSATQTQTITPIESVEVELVTFAEDQSSASFTTRENPDLYVTEETPNQPKIPLVNPQVMDSEPLRVATTTITNEFATPLNNQIHGWETNRLTTFYEDLPIFFENYDNEPFEEIEGQILILSLTGSQVLGFTSQMSRPYSKALALTIPSTSTITPDELIFDHTSLKMFEYGTEGWVEIQQLAGYANRPRLIQDLVMFFCNIRPVRENTADIFRWRRDNTTRAITVAQNSLVLTIRYMQGVEFEDPKYGTVLARGRLTSELADDVSYNKWTSNRSLSDYPTDLKTDYLSAGITEVGSTTAGIGKTVLISESSGLQQVIPSIEVTTTALRSIEMALNVYIGDFLSDSFIEVIDGSFPMIRLTLDLKSLSITRWVDQYQNIWGVVILTNGIDLISPDGTTKRLGLLNPDLFNELLSSFNSRVVALIDFEKKSS